MADTNSAALSSEAQATAPAKPVAFNFEHKALTVPGSVFSLLPGNGLAVLRVHYGDISGTVTLDQVRSAFGIRADSPDGRLLGIVERSLRFVRIIRHGDRIPSEILDGTASWTVEDRHREMAWLKLTTGLLAQLGIKGMVVAETEQAKAELRQAAATLAQRIGLPPDRKQEAVDRVETLANEMGFIESLREFYKPLFELSWKLKEIQRLNARDQQVAYDVKRAQELLKIPADRIRAALDSLDKKMEALVPALAEMEKTVKLVRSRRDMLHYQSMDWQHMLALWKDMRPGSNEAVLAIADLVRFLSLRFVQAKAWG